MTAYERMAALLRPTGLYRLDGETLVSRELCIWGEFLDQLSARLEKASANLFLQTADAEGLARFEELLGIFYLKRGEQAGKRQTLLARLAVGPRDFTRAGILRSLLAAGVEAELTESTADGRLIIDCQRFLTEYGSYDRLFEHIKTMLPAHLETVINVGRMRWVDFEALSIDFDRFDSADFTWDRFDLDGLGIWA